MVHTLTDTANSGDLNDNIESTSQGVHDKSQRSSDQEVAPPCTDLPEVNLQSASAKADIWLQE